MTPGSAYKTNGRVESEMNMVKKGVRTLIAAGACPLERWPLAARQVGERRLRHQLAQAGWPVGKLLRFGARAYALKNPGKTAMSGGATAVRKSWFGALLLELRSPQQPTL